MKYTVTTEERIAQRIFERKISRKIMVILKLENDGAENK